MITNENPDTLLQENQKPAVDTTPKTVRLKFLGYFKNTYPNSKFENLLLVALVLIGFLLTIYVVVGFVQDKYQKQKLEQQLNKIHSPTDTPTTTQIPVRPIDPNAWRVEISKNEIVPENKLLENNLIYAVKKDYSTTVYKRNLQKGNQTLILEYNEAIKAVNSGNFWEGLPPNIALSPDKIQLAYIDQEGLKIFNISSGSTRTLIRETAKSVGEEPPKWSIEDLVGVYALGKPAWSFDGKYISFLESQYEGSNIALIDTQSGNYTKLKSIYGTNPVWSSNSLSYIKASSGGYEGIGLYVSLQDNIFEAVDLTAKLGVEKSTPFYEANFSTDGNKIVFTYNWQEQSLGVANKDGSGFALLGNEGSYSRPIFSPGAESVFVVQKRGENRVLVEFNPSNMNIIDFAVLPTDFNIWRNIGWTKEGYLTIVGESNEYGSNLVGNSSRLLIMDLQNKKVVYASQPESLFTNFAGFSN